MEKRGPFPPFNLVPPSPELLNRLKKTAEQNRQEATYANKPYDLPGKGEWLGYNAKGKPTVKLTSGKVIEVIKTFNASIPLGSIVYVDERGVIDGKTIERPPDFKGKDYVPFKRTRKPAKPKPIIKTSPGTAGVVGRTWLVYEEHLQQLPWTTASGAGAAPITASTSEIITDLILRGAFTITNSALNLLLLSMTIPGIQIGAFFYEHTDTIPLPENHPGLPTGYTEDDYQFFCLISGYLQRFAYGSYGFQPLDGMMVGSGSINDVIYSIFTGDYHFAIPYFIRGNSSRYTENIAALIQHYGDYRVSFGFSRTVGVYPAKRYNINAVNWSPVETLNLANIERRNELPGPYGASQFTIPDDIQEWDYNEDFVYEVVPANKPIEHNIDGNTMPDDITKFAAYSGNSLYLNYVIKCYSPFGGDDRLLIRYYPLNLRVDASGQFSYKLGEATLNFPRQYLVRENPDFPMGSGENEPGNFLIRFDFRGVNDGGYAIQQEAYAIVGGPITSGVIPFFDWDERDNAYLYLSLKSVNGTEGVSVPGFSYTPATGYYEFDPSEWASILGPGEGVTLALNFDILGDNQEAIQNDEIPELILIVYGSNGLGQLPDPPYIEPPELVPPPYIPPEQPQLGVADFYRDTIQVQVPYPYDTDQGQFVDAWEIFIPLEEESVSYEYLGSSSTLRDVISYPEKLAPIVRLNGTFYYYESDISEITPELDVELVKNEEDKMIGFRILYAPDPFSISFLDEFEILSVYYIFSYSFNYAPYVGNFENLGIYPQRHLRREFAKNAFINDWRSMLNPTVSDEEGNPTDIDDEDINARDSNITPFNYDPVSDIFTSNFGYEVDVQNMLYNNSLAEVVSKVQGNFLFTGLLYPAYENLTAMPLINDPGGWRLRFYFVFDTNKERPLTEALAQDVLKVSFEVKDPQRPGVWFLSSDTNLIYDFTESDVFLIGEQLKTVPIQEKWDARMLPERINRNDRSGISWRYDIENSVWDKAYIFTAYNKQE